MTVRTELTGEPLRVQDVIAEVEDPSCGAVASFIGTVRSSAAAPGRENEAVESLEYEAHPEIAPQVLRSLAESAARRWQLVNLVAIHRTGVCALGEPTVVVACSAPHRAAALDACRWVIDELKSTVPIWKREVYSSGAAWVEREGATG